MKEGSQIQFTDFGIDEEQWRTYVHGKRMSEYAANRDRKMKHDGQRQSNALKAHDGRIKAEGSKPFEAFGERLPPGWGPPPSFDTMRPSSGFAVVRPQTSGTAFRRTM